MASGEEVFRFDRTACEHSGMRYVTESSDNAELIRTFMAVSEKRISPCINEHPSVSPVDRNPM